MRKAALIAALSCLLVACGNPKPPAGKWEGVYDTPDTMIAARVEIDKDGKVKVSAPDLTGIQTSDVEARAGMRTRLADQLASDWNDIAPRDFEFDGSKFRKPGGVAPQMEWDKDAARMTLVIYLGRDPARRMALRTVSEFSPNPFSSY